MQHDHVVRRDTVDPIGFRIGVQNEQVGIGLEIRATRLDDFQTGLRDPALDRGRRNSPRVLRLWLERLLLGEVATMFVRWTLSCFPMNLLLRVDSHCSQFLRQSFRSLFLGVRSLPLRYHIPTLRDYVLPLTFRL